MFLRGPKIREKKNTLLKKKVAHRPSEDDLLVILRGAKIPQKIVETSLIFQLIPISINAVTVTSSGYSKKFPNELMLEWRIFCFHSIASRKPLYDRIRP